MTKRTVCMSALSLLLLGLFLFISPMTIKTASAHALIPAAGGPCTGPNGSCNGQRPSICAGDANTLAIAQFNDLGGGYVEVRYSPNCNAYWGRITFYNSLNGHTANVTLDNGTDCDSNGGDGAVLDGQNYCYTPMADFAGGYAEADAYIDGNSNYTAQAVYPGSR